MYTHILHSAYNLYHMQLWFSSRAPFPLGSAFQRTAELFRNKRTHIHFAASLAPKVITSFAW